MNDTKATKKRGFGVLRAHDHAKLRKSLGVLNAFGVLGAGREDGLYRNANDPPSITINSKRRLGSFMATGLEFDRSEVRKGLLF